jgi:nitric oxide reductase subunit B
MTATLGTPASNAIVNPADDRPLSPWWLRAIVFVMVIGFTVLIAITVLAYRNAPPIPHMVTDPQGGPLFTGADIGDGQEVFLTD